MIQGYPITPRGVVDVGDTCEVNCTFCYHSFSPNNRFVSIDSLKRTLIKLKQNDRTHYDITGGSPPLYPHILELIRTGAQLGLKGRMITHDLTRAQEFVDQGLSSFLVSLHGLGEIHDQILQRQGYFERQVRGLRYLDNKGIPYGINTVICKQNYQTLPELARFLRSFNPKAVNLINFNPVAEWKIFSSSIKDICVPPQESSVYVNSVIEILEDFCVVNVRYYPLCFVLSGWERHVVNYPIYQFDPNEWCNIKDTVERVIERGQAKVRERNTLLPECIICSDRRICGGINSKIVKEFRNINVRPRIFNQDDDSVVITDLLFYRRHYDESFVPY